MPSKYEIKMERLRCQAQRQERRLSTAPSILEIAKYWSDKHVFEQFDWNTPACFACGFSGAANERAATLEGAWKQSRLERAHLMAASAGGSFHVSNFALLCKRCHREAPMIGCSDKPMIAWINRREQYVLWVIRRVTEEYSAISQTLLDDFRGLVANPAELNIILHTVMNLVRPGFHPGGDVAATLAQMVRGAVQIQKAMLEVANSRCEKAGK